MAFRIMSHSPSTRNDLKSPTSRCGGDGMPAGVESFSESPSQALLEQHLKCKMNKNHKSEIELFNDRSMTGSGLQDRK